MKTFSQGKRHVELQSKIEMMFRNSIRVSIKEVERDQMNKNEEDL